MGGVYEGVGLVVCVLVVVVGFVVLWFCWFLFSGWIVYMYWVGFFMGFYGVLGGLFVVVFFLVIDCR